MTTQEIQNEIDEANKVLKELLEMYSVAAKTATAGRDTAIEAIIEISKEIGSISNVTYGDPFSMSNTLESAEKTIKKYS